MSYDPAPTPGAGTVTTTQLGGDITAQAKVLLVAATEQAQRGVLALDESATISTSRSMSL